MFITVLAQVQYTTLSKELGLMLTKLSTTNVTDFIICNTIYYQIALNGTLMGKGQKTGFLDYKASLDFSSTNIQDAIQLICFINANGSPKLGYVSKTGEVKIEDAVIKGQLTFINVPTPPGVKQVVTTSDNLNYVLTEQGIFAIGQCKNYLCGSKIDQVFTEYTQISLDQQTHKNIRTIQYYNNNRIQQKFLFIYLNNQDVLALGNNNLGILPSVSYPDYEIIRHIGTGIKNPQIGYNVSRVENSLYYINGTTLTVFNHNSTPHERVVDIGVFDFVIQQYRGYIILVKEASLEGLVETSVQQKYLPYYCAVNPNDIFCIKSLIGELMEADCPVSSNNDYCRILACTV
ncbi:Hypothetical_protein [Hexamita inflata]|uniref:Hypothetical_protein n=1 Tax=Hexamita inflata TaxID=28002 RepID=A0ABP1I105_9EUKA